MAIISFLPAISASVEHLFSTFAFVHNKLRKRLGVEESKNEAMIKTGETRTIAVLGYGEAVGSPG